jgi:hypothetical protein
MKLTGVLTGVAALAVLTGGLALFQQREHLAALAAEATALRSARAAAAAQLARPTPEAEPADSLTEAERLELLRLRAEVTRLRGRQQELASVRRENAELKEQLAKSQPPPGFIRLREATFAGQATPEATLQSFFWAVAHSDTNALYQLLDDESVERLRRDLQESGRSELLTMGRILPGYLVIERRENTPTDVTLEVELLTGEDPQPMGLSLQNGRWRLGLY